MKKTIYFLMALFTLAFSSGVSAQTYFTDYGNYGRNDNARKLNSLSFTAAQNTTLSINQQTVQNTSPVYFDKTTQVIEIVPGNSLRVSFNWTGTWMRNIAYVDWNNDKLFSTTDATERIGYNASANSGNEMTKSITYTVPADQALGDYRMRIMVDWFDNHSSPNMAKSTLNTDGGSVVDVILRVTNTPAAPAPTLSFGASNLIVNGDVFTITPPAGATTVKYTTDNTDPATSPTAVTGTSVTATGNFKLRAISVKDGVNSLELVRDIKTIDLTLGNEYYIVFQRTGTSVNPTLALEDKGNGVAMQTQTLEYGKTVQRWTVSKGATDGLYKLTSIAGNIMYYNGSKFTVSATPAVDAQVDMRFITFAGTSGYTQYSGFEIQRKNSTTMGMNPIGGSAVGKEIGEWNNGDGGNTIQFVGMKDFLGNKITEATTLLGATTDGTDFGQFPTVARNDLNAAIVTAQGVYDDVNATEIEVTTATSTLNTAIITYNKSRNLPYTLSEGATEHWYYIRNLTKEKPRSQLAITFSAADATVKSTNFYTTEPTMWKVVTNADASSYGVVCKVGGVEYYINNELKLTKTAFTQWKGLLDSSGDVSGWRFEYAPGGTLTAAMHQSNNGPDYNLITYNSRGDISSLWRFETLLSLMQLNITKATTILSNTAQGEEPGQFPTAARSTLQAAINTASQKITDETVVYSDFTTLQSAIVTYNAAVILPLVSTEGNDKWYFFQGTRPANTYMTSKGAGVALRSEAVIPNDTQLWKLVANTSGTANGYALINKATGQYLDANTADDNTDVKSRDDLPTNNLRFILSDIYTNKTARFWVEHSEGSTPNFRLHAGGGNILNWNGNRYDNSSWLIISYSTALKVFLKTGIDNATARLAATTEGTEFGQFPAAARSTLTDAIATAQGVYDNGTATENAINAAVLAINDAVTTYNGQMASYSSLISTNVDNYRWYKIKNRNYPTKVITANTVVENGTVICRDGGTSTDAELWRFELNQAGTTVKIISKSQSTLGIQENGQSVNAKLISFVNASEFVIGQQGAYLTFQKSGGGTHNYLHCDGSSNLVGWEAAAPATQWTLEYVSETAKPQRTLTLTANAAQGTAVITGTANTSVSTNSSTISASAVPANGYDFTNWTNTDGGALVSTNNPYIYNGITNLNLTANFASIGTFSAPVVSTIDNPVYYYIYSASNGTVTTGTGPTTDLRSNVLISPAADGGQLIRNTLASATTTNHALWAIVNDGGTIKLKNKATGYFVNGKTATAANTNAFTYTLISGNQYSLKNSDTNFLIAWNTNLCDLWPSAQGANSLTAWYFVSPTFTGTGDLATAANWTNATVPASQMNVVIDGDATATAHVSFNSMTINSGKSLTVAPGKQLTVSSSFVINGTLTLQSDATGTATILSPATITSGTGAVYNVQQYLTGSSDNTARQWWYLSSPVSSAKSSVFDPAGPNNMGYYDETLSTPAYVQFTDNNQNLTVGKGYVTQLKSTGTYTFTGGTLNNGDITLTPTRTGATAAKRGFNLVGNPYPSYLNWDAAYTATVNPPSNMRNAIWYRTYSGGAMTFHTYADGDGVPEVTTGWIPPMQAFWVKVKADGNNGSITFKNTYRSHATGSTFPLKAKALTEKQRLRLVVTNGVNTDETLIVGKSYASAAYDEFDAEKMSNNNAAIPEIYSMVENQELVINSVDQLTEGKTVTLGFRPGQTGTNFTIEATQLENIDAKVMLLDKVAGTEQELTAGTPYSFTVSDATPTTDRFVISLVSKMPTGIETGTASGDMTVYTNRNNRIQLIYRGELNDQTAVSVYNVAGQMLSTQKLVKAATELSGTFRPGVYMIQLSDGTKKATHKLVIK